MAKNKKGKNRKKKSVPKTAMINSSKLSYNMAKKMKVSTISRSLAPRIYSFVRYIETEQTIASNDFGFTSSSMTFSLNKLTFPAEFTGLFDQYQIVKTETTFQPDIQQVNQLIGSSVANALTIPKIYVIRDLDNTGTITEDVAKERQDVVIKQATQKFSVSMVPQVSREIYRSTTQTAYEVPYQLTWLDCSYSDVPHYGLRFGITNSESSQNAVKFEYVIRSRYWVRFRQVR